jgi:predicted phage-related endonuclease
LGLVATRQAERTKTIGGSDANTILSGDEGRIVRLWREKRSAEQPEDLSDKLPVMLGCWTEDFSRQWYARVTGQEVTRQDEVVSCDLHKCRSATLDGFVEPLGAVFEAKLTSQFTKSEELLARYMPQLQHGMAVVRCEMALLSVIFGNSKWECFGAAADRLY